MSVNISTARGVLRLSINDAKSRNAFDREVVAELRKALAEARDNPELRLVQIESGVSGVFALGMNLKSLAAAPEAGVWSTHEVVADYAELLIDLLTFPVPSLAIVDGIAAAGGVELACACDTVFATANASFSIAQLRNGIFPFITSAVLVPRIGQARFLHWALSGQSLPAKRLFDLGLVNQLCPPGELERSASVFADRVVGFDPATLRAGISALRADADPEIRRRIRHALSLFTLNCLALRQGGQT